MTQRTLFLAVVMIFSIGSAQRSIPLNIEQLTQRAGVIVDATVMKTETGKDPQSGFLVTWVTVEVNENFFGASGKQYRFKQYGGEANGLANYPKHLPRYTAGERAILFLTGPSKVGMQSPVGMQQGVFALVKEGTAKTRIKNIELNPSLFKGITSAKGFEMNMSSYNETDGSMEYEEFAEMIRSYVRHIKQ